MTVKDRNYSRRVPDVKEYAMTGVQIKKGRLVDDEGTLVVMAFGSRCLGNPAELFLLSCGRGFRKRSEIREQAGRVPMEHTRTTYSAHRVHKW